MWHSSFKRCLHKMDTSVKWIPTVSCCLSLLPLFNSLSDRHLSKRRTFSVGPEGVHLRGSWLYYTKNNVLRSYFMWRNSAVNLCGCIKTWLTLHPCMVSKTWNGHLNVTADHHFLKVYNTLIINFSNFLHRSHLVPCFSEIFILVLI